MKNSFPKSTGELKKDILLVFEYYNVRRGPIHGDNFMYCCPQHKENTPSFGISYKTGRWNCFGCGVKGNDLISFISKMERISRSQAGQMFFGGEESETKHQRIIEYLKVVGNETENKIEEKKMEIPNLQLSEVNKSETVKKWCKDNNLTIKELNEFGVKWCEKGNYQGYLAAPIIDLKGKIISYEFRRVNAEGKKVLYGTGFQTAKYVYNLNRIKNENIILVEGAKDVWTLNRFGYKNAVSCFGTHIGVKHCKAMLEKGIKTITIFFDSDDAGFKGAFSARDELIKYFNVNFVFGPDGTDPNDLDEETLRRCLEDSVTY